MDHVHASFDNPNLHHKFIPSPSFMTLEKLGLFSTGSLVGNGDHSTSAENLPQGDEKNTTSEATYRRLNRFQRTYAEPVRHRLTRPLYSSLCSSGHKAQEGLSTILIRALSMLRERGEGVFFSTPTTGILQKCPLCVAQPLGGSLVCLAGGCLLEMVTLKVGRPKSHPQTKPNPRVDRSSFQPESVAPPGQKELFIAEAERCQPSNCVPHIIVKMHASAIRRKCVRSPFILFNIFSICPGRRLFVSPLATELCGNSSSSVSIQMEGVGDTGYRHKL